MPRLQLAPHHIPPSHNVRTIYIQHLTDLLHVCLSKGDHVRARRAWAILIRCREVDWKSRWYWGLLLLDLPAIELGQLNAAEASILTSTQTSLPATQPYSTQTQPWTQTQTQGDGREAEKWLKALRVSSPEAQRPAILHALVLHMIKHDRHRAALDELETYLSSYPYLTSAPLHVYAGMLCFYLAQPESSRRLASDPAMPASSSHSPMFDACQANRADRAMSSPVADDRSATPEPPNMSRLRTARGWFVKALELDRKEAVSLEFLQLIRELDRDGVLGDDGATPWARADTASDSEEDQVMLGTTYRSRHIAEDDGLSTDSEADSVARRDPDTSFRSEMDAESDLDSTAGQDSPTRRFGDAQVRAQGRVDPRLAFRLSSDSDDRHGRRDQGGRRKNAANAARSGGRGAGHGESEDDGLSTESEGGLVSEDDGLSSD